MSRHHCAIYWIGLLYCCSSVAGLGGGYEHAVEDPMSAAPAEAGPPAARAIDPRPVDKAQPPRDDPRADWARILGDDPSGPREVREIVRDLPPVDAATARGLVGTYRDLRDNPSDAAKARAFLESLSAAYPSLGLRAGDVFLHWNQTPADAGLRQMHREMALAQAREILSSFRTPRPPAEWEIRGFAAMLSQHPEITGKNGNGPAGSRLFSLFLQELPPNEAARLSQRVPGALGGELRQAYDRLANADNPTRFAGSSLAGRWDTALRLMAAGDREGAQRAFRDFAAHLRLETGNHAPVTAEHFERYLGMDPHHPLANLALPVSAGEASLPSAERPLPAAPAPRVVSATVADAPPIAPAAPVAAAPAFAPAAPAFAPAAPAFAPAAPAFAPAAPAFGISAAPVPPPSAYFMPYSGAPPIQYAQPAISYAPSGYSFYPTQRPGRFRLFRRFR